MKTTDHHLEKSWIAEEQKVEPLTKLTSSYGSKQRGIQHHFCFFFFFFFFFCFYYIFCFFEPPLFLLIRDCCSLHHPCN
jgi:hypothetical protein